MKISAQAASGRLPVDTGPPRLDKLVFAVGKKPGRVDAERAKLGLVAR